MSDLDDAKEVFGENLSENSASSGKSNIPEFMRKPPFQKGLVGLIWNIILAGIVGGAWLFYGIYLGITKLFGGKK